MQDVLTDKFYEFIQAIQENNTSKIESMAEKRFATQVINGLDKVKNNNFVFEKDGEQLLKDIVKQDSTDYGDLRGNLVSDN